MRRSNGATCGVIALALAMAACPAAAGPGNILTPIGPIAETQRLELIWATVLILIAILPVLVGVPIIMWRYRRTNTKATYRPQWEFDTKLEILMWAGPTLIVVALSIWLAQATFRIDPYRSIDAEMAEGLEIELTGPPLNVEVIGLDWKWLFIYPDEGVASVGELVLPTGRPVTMRLTTDTVMQSFMAPGLAGQIYAMAGMVTQLNLVADRPGEAFLQNTQYNGTGFPDQRAPVRAVPPEEYEDWLAAAMDGDGPVLDDRGYALLAQSGDLARAHEDLDIPGEGPIRFRLAGLGLFDRVLGRYMGADPVLPAAQPGSPTYDPERSLLPVLGMSHSRVETMPCADAACFVPDTPEH